jgi:hypothetical protein
MNTELSSLDAPAARPERREHERDGGPGKGVRALSDNVRARHPVARAATPIGPVYGLTSFPRAAFPGVKTQWLVARVAVSPHPRPFPHNGGEIRDALRIAVHEGTHAARLPLRGQHRRWNEAFRTCFPFNLISYEPGTRSGCRAQTLTDSVREAAQSYHGDRASR